jgi:hypothetical protein
MLIIKALQLGLCGAVLCAVLGTAVRADDWNKKTVVTFGESVEIPGQVLPAGTYVFKLFDSQANRNLVQVWNADETHLIANLQTNADCHFPPTLTSNYEPNHPKFEYDERPAGQPMALRSWFYPGELYGHQFIYPNHESAPDSASFSHSSTGASGR